MIRDAELSAATGTELDHVNQPEQRQKATPPDRRMEASELHTGRIDSRGPLVDAIAKDHGAVDDEQDADEKPDWNSRTVHVACPFR